MAPAWERAILHADMDAFYASIEQRDNPEYRGKPVIVGGTGRRGVVAAASYEAREYGVHSAMPTAIAKRKCPKGIYVHPRFSVYSEVSQHVREVFLEITPLIEPLSLDEAFLDVTGSQALFGDPVTIARKVKDDVRARTELTISVGVASCKYVAKVASDLDKPDGLTVCPAGEEMEFLAPLPVKRLWGAGPVTQKKMAGMGLHTIADLQAKSLDQLVALLGERMGTHYYELSRGIDDRAVVTGRDPKSVSHEVTFSEDLKTRDECHQVMMELSEMVARRLRRGGWCGRVVKLKLRDPDFKTYSRQRKLEHPTDDELVIHRTVRTLFDGVRETMAPVRLLGVGVAELSDRKGAGTGDLFGGVDESAATDERPRELLDALDRIKDRFGDSAIKHGRSGSDSHRGDDLFGPE